MALRRLEKYDILEEVGQGGMAKVFRGFDTTLGREVAVKILHPHLAEQRESKLRLQREAQAVAKLRHENILEIFDYSGPDAAESYIVTEYIHGPTLKQFLDRKGSIAFPELAAMIAVEVCRALSHAHARGIIHRDIKPENVMIRDDGVIKLTDFGIAQVVDKERMTVTGQLLGSPAYMAPEHVEGRPLDFRTDVFSLGILLYQLSTGELPFKGKNPHEVLKRIGEGRHIDPRIVKPQVGQRLGRIIEHMLQRAPADRYPDVTPVLDELLGYLREVEITDPRGELARFFAAPEDYVRAFEPRLLEALVRRAREALAEGRRAHALEFLSRALTVRPDCVEARLLFARLEKRARLAWAAAGVALVGALGSAWLVQGRVRPLVIASGPAALAQPVASPNPSPTASPGPRPGPGPKADVPAPTPAPAAAPPVTPAIDETAAKLPRKRAPAPAQAAKKTVRIESFPKAVSLFLDGKSVPFDDAHPILEVPGTGKHKLRFENPACYPDEREITGEVVKVHLRWKPARILIETNVRDPILLVRGRPVRGGIIEAEVTGDSREITIEVEASAPGYEPRRQICRGLANEEKSCHITLEKVQ
ncbi:MAG TPA: protein kinase [Polyangia bacterium]|nr:protein kinase [Polyangia bacterium]